MIKVFAPKRAVLLPSADGELARVCKIAPQRHARRRDFRNLIEITLLTNKMGVPASRLSIVPQQRRHGLDVHRVQVTGAGQSRLGPRHSRPELLRKEPRPSFLRLLTRSGRADADHRGDPRDPTDAHGSRHGRRRTPRNISPKDFATLMETHGACRPA